MANLKLDEIQYTGSPRRSRVCHSRFRLFAEIFLSLVLLFATRSLDYSRFSLLSSVVSWDTKVHNLIRISILSNIIYCFYCSILILDPIVSTYTYIMPKRKLVGDCKARLYYLGMVLRFATRVSISFIYHFIYYHFTCASVCISVTAQLLNQ